MCNVDLYFYNSLLVLCTLCGVYFFTRPVIQLKKVVEKLNRIKHVGEYPQLINFILLSKKNKGKL